VPVHCTSCAAALPVWVVKARDSAMCPNCNADLMIRVFPALLAARDIVDTRALQIEEGEASCFYHSTKRASASCAQCGRFVCALCAVDFEGKAWCPTCFESATSRRKHRNLENHRILYDSIAFGLVTVPALLYFIPALITAPAAIYVSIRYWKRPTSLIPRWKWRFPVAILLAMGELALLAIFVYAVVHQVGRRPR
jgi:hypothetical protein